MHYKARPTTYSGIKMRSRLEAHFAARMDRLCTWEYEPECFADASGQYLPDFLLKWSPDPLDWVYVEIKPRADVAWAAAKRMEVVLSSLPDAKLAVYTPNGYPYEGHDFTMQATRWGTRGEWRGPVVPGGNGPASAARAQFAATRAERARPCPAPAVLS